MMRNSKRARTTRSVTGCYCMMVLALATFMMTATGCSTETQGGPPRTFNVNVVGYKAQVIDLSQTISLVGTLEANEFVEIKNEVEGVIEKINFTEGLEVAEGKSLVVLDQSKLEARYDQAKASLQLAQTTADRYERLVQSKAVSQQEYDQTVANLENSRASVALAKELLDDSTIVAPFTGIVGERLVSPGQYIQPGTLLTYLFDKDPMKVTFHVPERYFGKIRVGTPIQVKVDAYPDKSFDGEVYFRDPRIDTETRTVLVKAKTPNSGAELSQGMFANVEMVVDDLKPAIVVPETALIIKGSDVFVYVVDAEQSAQIKRVEIGQQLKGMVQILAGIAEDETVITEGHQKLAPGAKVNVRYENPDERAVYDVI